MTDTNDTRIAVPQKTAEGLPFYQVTERPAASPQDPWSGMQEYAPGTPPPSTPAQGEDPWVSIEKYTAEKPGEVRPEDISMPEAAMTGLRHGATFGFDPALEGLGAVSDPATAAAAERLGVTPEHLRSALPPGARAAYGATKLLSDWITGSDDPAAKEAYERGRKDALNREKWAGEEHPIPYLAGTLAGTVAAPGFGAMRAAGVGGRAVQGAVQGGIGGALFGAGEATSEGKSPGQVAQSAAVGGAVGAPLGATVGAVAGPRAAQAVTPGQRAAATAEDLGAPLPVGVASDSPRVQATTGALTSLPIVGPRITERVNATRRAAGERVGDIANTMAGGAPERSAADAMVRPGLQQAINANRANINGLYGNLRGQIDQDAQFAMPNTQNALRGIMQERADAGWADPRQGLDQAWNVAQGATFNAAHRARVDVRSAGDVLNPHPGYNANDFNRVTRAMTTDLRSMVQDASIDQSPAGRQATLRAFENAEQNFGPLSQLNGLLNRIANAQGEGAISRVLGASREKGGNLQLLTHLRQTMPPDAFNAIGGTLLSELGRSARLDGDFSLAQFGREFSKLSDGAVNTLFPPNVAANLRDIAQMGQHIRETMEQTSSSHSSNWLAITDIMKDIALLSFDVGMHGGGGGLTAAGVGSTAATYGMAYLLGNPARIASVGAFMRAYRAITFGQQTPARLATFKIATRNLANTLGVPVNQIADSVARRLSHGEEPQREKETNVQSP